MRRVPRAFETCQVPDDVIAFLDRDALGIIVRANDCHPNFNFVAGADHLGIFLLERCVRVFAHGLGFGGPGGPDPMHPNYFGPFGPLVVDKPVVTIEFAAGSSAINHRYDDQLRKIVDLVNADPTLQIRIAAHTDNVGNPHANYLFSQKRAQSVKNYLVRKLGVDRRRITAKGYGHYQPVADNSTAEGRRMNRRVVTIVLSEK